MKKFRIKQVILLGVVCLMLTSCSSKTDDKTKDDSAKVRNTTSENQTSNNDNSQSTNDDVPQSRDVFAMDTYMTLTAYGQNAEEALNQAESEIERLDALLSTGDENSEIYALNQNGSGEISEDTEMLLEESENKWNIFRIKR